MMNYKKLALTVAAGAMATTVMAQSAPKLNANNIEEVIKQTLIDIYCDNLLRCIL